MKWMILRHGITKGNKEKRYIGITDEPLLEEGRKALIKNKERGAFRDAEAALEDGALLYVSPLTRCRETAEIIFRGRVYIVEDDLREIDFGEFEGKNYEELNGTEEYQQWIDSNGELPFPGGESQKGFVGRIRKAFLSIREEALKKNRETIVIVAHGGVIMAAREIFGEGTFYDSIPENGDMYIVEGNIQG